MKTYASCSFGKDSMAAIVTAIKQGIPIDGVIYARIMFDDEISAELPEHEEWIHNKAIPLLKSRYGLDTHIVQDTKTYCDRFFTPRQSGKFPGNINGFPMLRGPWCNKLKTIPIKRLEKEIGGHRSIVGIAADEGIRIERQQKIENIIPLVDCGITEEMAFDICRENDLLSPAYNNGRKRLGCWFCHNQRISELRRLRKEYPDYWELLMALDEISPIQFTQRSSVHDFDRRFATEDMQLTIFDFIEQGGFSNEQAFKDDGGMP